MGFWNSVWETISGSEDELPPAVALELEHEAEVEPAPPEVVQQLELKGPLPESFPAHRQLHEAGINTYGQLAKIGDPKVVAGVGPQLAAKIASRLVCDLRDVNESE